MWAYFIMIVGKIGTPATYRIAIMPSSHAKSRRSATPPSASFSAEKILRKNDPHRFASDAGTSDVARVHTRRVTESWEALQVQMPRKKAW